MSSISKPDHCAERPSLVLLSAYQEYLMTFKLMTSQVVQRARPLITHICVVGIQRVKPKHCAWSVLTFVSVKFSSTFMPLQCKSCKSAIGRIYRTTPRELDHLRYASEYKITTTVVWYMAQCESETSCLLNKNYLMLKHCLLWLCWSILFCSKQMFLSTNNSLVFLSIIWPLTLENVHMKISESVGLNNVNNISLSYFRNMYCLDVEHIKRWLTLFIGPCRNLQTRFICL